ncbi:MAG: enoyl-CoA hydratase family protein [Lautropia sp.]
MADADSSIVDQGSLRVDRRGPVLELSLSNPGARNALSPAIYAAGCRAFELARADETIRAVLLFGADGFFCAGGNLNRLKANRQHGPDQQRRSIDDLHEWITAIRQCPKPVVAAVQGAAAGAGFSLALACDLIVAAADARFVMSYARVGLSPDGGAIAALAAALAPQQVFAICALADPIGAPALQQAGIVHQLSEPAQTLADARALCARLAQGPTAVYGRIKRMLAEAPRRAAADHLAQERDAFVDSLFSDDALEGIDAFLGKRSANFKGA